MRCFCCAQEADGDGASRRCVSAGGCAVGMRQAKAAGATNRARRAQTAIEQRREPTKRPISNAVSCVEPSIIAVWAIKLRYNVGAEAVTEGRALLAGRCGPRTARAVCAGCGAQDGRSTGGGRAAAGVWRGAARGRRWEGAQPPRESWRRRPGNFFSRYCMLSVTTEWTFWPVSGFGTETAAVDALRGGDAYTPARR